MTNENVRTDLIGFTNQQMHFNKTLVERIVRLEIDVRRVESKLVRLFRWLLIIISFDILYFGIKLFYPF